MTGGQAACDIIMSDLLVRAFLKIKQITEIYLVTCLTLAPIWLPHWPAWMCTISRIFAAVSLNERYKFQTRKPHVVDTSDSVSATRLAVDLCRRAGIQSERAPAELLPVAAAQSPSAGARCINAHHQIGLLLPTMRHQHVL